MKHKGKKNGAVVLIMCIVLVVLAAFIIVLVMQRGNKTQPEVDNTINTENVDGENTGTESDGAAGGDTSSNAATSENGEFIEIETPYATLLYPDIWSDYLKVITVDGEPYVVEFYGVVEGKEMQLFDIYFGDQEESLGVIDHEGSEVEVGIKYCALEFDDSWSEKDRNTIYSMQEASNEIIGKLELNDASGVDEVVEITTPYGVLKYPGNWKEFLQTEQNDGDVYSVDFYGKVEGKEKILLFSIAFGGEEGTLLGTVTTDSGDETTVNIIFNDVEFDEDWNDTEKNSIFAMQEDANYLIDNLSLN